MPAPSYLRGAVAVTLALLAVRCGARASLLDGQPADPSADAGSDVTSFDAKPDVVSDAAPDANDAGPPKTALGAACDGIDGNPFGCGSNMFCFTGDEPDDAERWPGGYCTKNCNSSSQCQPLGGACVGAELGQGRCLRFCDVPTDCRQGYACISPPFGSGEKVCTPTGFIATRAAGVACFQHQDPVAPHYAPPLVNQHFGPAQQFDAQEISSDEIALARDPAGFVVLGANVISPQGYQNPAFAGSGSTLPMAFSKTSGPFDPKPVYYSDPYLVVDDAGVFYYSTLGLDAQASHAQLLVASSSDHGQSWTTAQANPESDCNPSSQPGAESVCLDHPWLAVGPDKLDPKSQALYAAYLATPPGDYMAVLIRSTDGGKTWGLPGAPGQSLPVFGLSDTGTFVNLITPAVAEDGTVHMVALSVFDEPHGSTQNSVYYCRSEDGGKTHTPRTTVNPPGESIVFDQPVIATDAGTIWVVYTRGQPDGAWDTVLARSTDGATWSYEVVNDEPEPCATHFHPTLAVDRTTHRVYVAWYDGRFAPYEGAIAMAVCDPQSPGAEKCGPNEAISDVPFYITTDRKTLAFIGDYFTLAALPGGELWAGWGDTRFDNLSHGFVAKGKAP